MVFFYFSCAVTDCCSDPSLPLFCHWAQKHLTGTSLPSLTSLTPSLGLWLNLCVRLVLAFWFLCFERVSESPNESWVWNSNRFSASVFLFINKPATQHVTDFVPLTFHCQTLVSCGFSASGFPVHLRNVDTERRSWNVSRGTCQVILDQSRSSYLKKVMWLQ